MFDTELLPSLCIQLKVIEDACCGASHKSKEISALVPNGEGSAIYYRSSWFLGRLWSCLYWLLSFLPNRLQVDQEDYYRRLALSRLGHELQAVVHTFEVARRTLKDNPDDPKTLHDMALIWRSFGRFLYRLPLGIESLNHLLDKMNMRRVELKDEKELLSYSAYCHVREVLGENFSPKILKKVSVCNPLDQIEENSLLKMARLIKEHEGAVLPSELNLALFQAVGIEPNSDRPKKVSAKLTRIYEKLNEIGLNFILLSADPLHRSWLQTLSVWSENQLWDHRIYEEVKIDKGLDRASLSQEWKVYSLVNSLGSTLLIHTTNPALMCYRLYEQGISGGDVRPLTSPVEITRFDPLAHWVCLRDFEVVLSQVQWPETKGGLVAVRENLLEPIINFIIRMLEKDSMPSSLDPSLWGIYEWKLHSLVGVRYGHLDLVEVERWLWSVSHQYISDSATFPKYKERLDIFMELARGSGWFDHKGSHKNFCMNLVTACVEDGDDFDLDKWLSKKSVPDGNLRSALITLKRELQEMLRRLGTCSQDLDQVKKIFLSKYMNLSCFTVFLPGILEEEVVSELNKRAKVEE